MPHCNSLSAADHSATFYIINTSENQNGWAVTEKSLQEALPTLKKASLGIGPDQKFEVNTNKALAVGAKAPDVSKTAAEVAADPQ